MPALNSRPLKDILSSVNSGSDSSDWTETLNELAAKGIQDDVSLLFTTLPLHKQSHLEARTLVERYYVAPVAIASDLYASRKGKEPERWPLSIGLSSLDGLLDSGLRPGVYELSGSKSVGKTLLALHCVMERLFLSATTSVLWLDTESDFSVERAFAMLTGIAAKYHGQNFSTPDSQLEAVLDRLTVARSESLQGLIEAIEKAKANAVTSGLHLQLVVLDSLSVLYKDRLNVASAQGYASLVALIRHLRQQARSEDRAYLVLNTSAGSLPNLPISAFAATNQKPALGGSFTFLCDATIWLSRARDVVQDVEGRIIVAELLRSRRCLDRSFCTFVLDGLELRKGVQ